ncbi:hypothetical protein [Oceanicaulis sp.]|uniref:hypothetical protein n=1 Tax=Oceanicaulis sp. TaxID=1924941 RepID=UPI003D29C1B7
MSYLITEFPITPIADKASFMAEAVRWIRGMKGSQILDKYNTFEKGDDYTHVENENGESLTFRITEKGHSTMIGFVHSRPDDEKRIWRTESVLTTSPSEEGFDVITIKSQCLAAGHGAILQTPNKPYFIKNIIVEGWPLKDKLLAIQDLPHYLKDEKPSIELATKIINGSASNSLPVVYISSIRNKVLNSKQIENLAFKLGGIAHVVVEPSTAFSSELQAATKSTNPYMGTIGLCAPTSGIVAKFYLGGFITNSNQLLEIVQNQAIKLRSNTPLQYPDWNTLQETSLKSKTPEKSGDLEEYVKLLEEENSQLRDSNKDLLSRTKSQSYTYHRSERSPDVNLDALSSVELYSGELADRIHHTLNLALKNAESIGMDERTALFCNMFMETYERNNELDTLRDRLKKSVNGNGYPKEIISTLNDYNYTLESEKKHIKLAPSIIRNGLESITLSKTPSDHRSLLNAVRDIEKAMKINNMK